jgi:hypothetical protein
MMAPLGAQAVDLGVWREKGFYPQADEAVTEIVPAFEQGSGKPVELVQVGQDEIMEEAATADQAGRRAIFCSAP